MSDKFNETTSQYNYSVAHSNLGLNQNQKRVAKVDIEKLKAIRSTKNLLKTRLKNSDPGIIFTFI